MLLWGNLKSPYLDDGEKPDIGSQALEQAKRDEIIHGAGPALAADAGTVTSLMASDGFNGLLLMQQDTAQVWARKAGATIPLPVNARRQLDTINDTAGLVVQTGAGKIQGNATTTANEVVTFPVAFGATPIVIVTATGTKATGAFSLASLLTSTAYGSAFALSASQFNAQLTAPTALPNTNDFYYSWIALGTP